jgi:hypothetical protein
LLDGHPRAIKMFETFPLMRPSGRPLLADSHIQTEKGHRITLLNESQFWRLAGRAGSSPTHHADTAVAVMTCRGGTIQER